MDRFASNPASVRNAAWLIIGSTVGIVLIGGLVIWVFDSAEYPDYGSALWYTLQTVTTVGYGDQVPSSPIGRLVGSLVMVVAIALISIVTASITSTFVEAAQRRHRAGQEAQDRDAAKVVDERLDEIVLRLSAIERSIDALEPGRGSASSESPPPHTR
jgi:voltage-gated potassium channel